MSGPIEVTSQRGFGTLEAGATTGLVEVSRCSETPNASARRGRVLRREQGVGQRAVWGDVAHGYSGLVRYTVNQ